MKKENTLKISIPFEGLKITLWKVIKKDPDYIMFNASIMSSKKNKDGTWLNEYSTITCAAREEAMHKIAEIYEEKKKISINGNLSFNEEKRMVIGKNGEYPETIYTKPIYNIKSFEELLEDGKTIHYAKKNNKSNNDIPF
jgi:hypothetical protein